jgi:DNA-binding MarR family transcriptional regulator/GNAT superfamily N-acetyltransferase
MTAAIERVRRFNRTVGEQIGALDDRFLGRRRPIGASRILWEIGAAGIEIRTLRVRLGLDSGYLTRVLQALRRERLVRIGPSRSDRRVRVVALTRKGSRERAELDRLSDDLAARILEPLDDEQRRRLVDAMTTVDQLVRLSMVSFSVESADTPDARWCLRQYFAELDRRFERGFDPAQSISADVQELRPPRGLLLIGRMRRHPVACGALKFHRHRPAELKRMWIAPAARGLGVGKRMLAELERQARASGATAIRLETNRALTEAIGLYRRSGYVEVPPFNDEPYAHHWFEKPLGQ